MRRYLKIAAPVITLLSLAIIFALRTLPAGKLWKEYAVIYVPSDSSDADAMQAISDAGINGAVSLSGQFLPSNLTQNSIEYSIYKIRADSPASDYIQKRAAYFFDRTRNYRLYYIPSAEKSKIPDALSNLSARSIAGGADISASYPWILPLISALLVIVLAFFSKNRMIFLASALIPVANLFCNPFYQMAEATCLILLCLFFISNVWRRKGAVKYLLGNHSVPAMIIVAVLCAFTCAPKSGAMLIVALFGTACCLLTIYEAERFFESKSSFVPVYIRPAKKIPVSGKNAATTTGTAAASALIILAVILISSLGTKGAKSSSRIFLPANAHADESLGQLEEFYRWTWDFRTAPYRSLNKAQDDFFVEFPRFAESSGTIAQTNVIMSYDQNFRDSAYDSIDDFGFESIEKVLKSEGKDFKGGYSVTNSYPVGLLGVIMSLICVFVLLFLYVSTIIRKGIKK